MEINVPLGSWLPDLPGLNNPGVTTAYNVIPTFGVQQGTVTYEPILRAALYSATSMASRPLGSAVGADKLNTAKVYAGCATKLYKIDPGTRGWVDISRPGGYTTSEGENWRSTEYGNVVMFANYNSPIQYINKDLDLQFADATTLVQCRHIATVRDFIVVGNTYDALDGAVPFRVRWSGLGLPLSWNYSQATGADFQDIYGLGAVQGIVGGEAGWIIMEKGIVKMSFDGYPYWFRFDTVPMAKGCAVPQSITVVDGNAYFLGSDGFHMMNGQTGQTTPIGVGKVDQTFLKDVDTGQYSYMTAAVDPRRKHIYWNYMSMNATTGVPDKVLIYNYVTGDWSQGDATADFIFNSISLPWTIDMFDVFGTIDDIPASPDSPLWAGGNSMLWAMKSDGSIYTFTGENLPAQIETGEQLFTSALKAADPNAASSDRTRITRIRPLFDGVGDGGEATVRVGSRGTSNGVVNWSDPMPLHPETQFAYPRVCDRFHRFGVSLSGTWTSVSSIQIDIKSAGRR